MWTDGFYVKVVDADGKPVPTLRPPSFDDDAEKTAARFHGAAAADAAEAEAEAVVDAADVVHPEQQQEAFVGEVWVKGPTLCAGYWNRPKARNAHEL